MKKLGLVLMCMLLAAFVFAEGTGLTAGVEFGFDSLNKEGVDAIDTAYLRPNIAYENNELAENVDLYLELGIPFWSNPEFWLGIDFTLDGGYTVQVSDAGSLRIGLNALLWIPAATDKDTFTFGYSPELQPYKGPFGGMGGSEDPEMYLIPGVRYTHALDNMSFFGEVNMPLYVLTQEGMDALDIIPLNILLGMNMDNGFGIEIEITNFIKDYTPDQEVSFFDYVTITPSYENEKFYALVEVGIPTFDNGMDIAGLYLCPEFGYNVMDNFQIYAGLPISNVGSDKDKGGSDVEFGLYVGAKYSF